MNDSRLDQLERQVAEDRREIEALKDIIKRPRRNAPEPMDV